MVPTGATSIPEPDHIASDGLRQIPVNVSRVLESVSSFASLIISTADGSRAFSVYSRDSEPQLSFVIDWRREPDIERALRDTFERLGTAPVHDYRAGNGCVVDATRILTYPVSKDSTVLTALCEDVLRRIFGVPPMAGLDFTYRTN